MRTAVIAFACLLAVTVAGVAAEPSEAPMPYPAPAAVASKLNVAPTEMRIHPQDQVPRAHENGRPPHGRVCFGQTETREKIAYHHLADPLRALRLGRSLGEALSAKLCRWKPDEFVYEIHVLRRDGRVLRVYMNAQNGEALSGSAPANQNVQERDRDRN